MWCTDAQGLVKELLTSVREADLAKWETGQALPERVRSQDSWVKKCSLRRLPQSYFFHVLPVISSLGELPQKYDFAFPLRVVAFTQPLTIKTKGGDFSEGFRTGPLLAREV